MVFSLQLYGRSTASPHAESSHHVMEDVQRLIRSRRGYRTHLKQLFRNAEEIIERCDNDSPETEDSARLAELIEQLERKRTILTDLDRQISVKVSDDDLEDEILETENLQFQVSSTIAWVKRRVQKLQAPTRQSPPLSPPSNSRSPSPSSSDTNTESLPTTQASEPRENTQSDFTKSVHPQDTQTKPQGSADRQNVSDSLTKPLELQFRQQHLSNAVCLPKLDLCTFSGNTLEWQPFWDSFNAAVNSNPTISDVQKLNYLRSQLQGEASQLIAGFSLTSANYSHSAALLKDHYGQQQKLITAHMQALLELPNPSNTLSSLQSFHDTIERHMQSLVTLGKSIDSYGDLLAPVILNKLPQKTRKNKARGHNSNEWNLTDLQEAVRKEIRVLESELINGHLHQSLHPTAAFYTSTTKVTTSSQPSLMSQRSCVFCKGSHSPKDCKVIADNQARKEFVKQRNLCFNCLGRHKVSTCTSKHRCRKCRRKHHTSLCTDSSSEPNTPRQDTTKEPIISSATLSTTVSPPTTTTALHLAGNNICILKTAVATVSAEGTYVEANILFDEGSQRSFITKSLADCLTLQPHGTEELSISTFGTRTSHVNKLDVATIYLHTISGQPIPLTVLIVPTIAAPLQNRSKKPLTNFPHLKGLHLAHPVTSTEQFVINLLIGADHYWDVVEDHIIKGNGPTAMGSKLGYFLSGPMGTTTQENTTANILHVATTPIPDPDLQRFWSVESLGTVPKDDTANTFLKHYIKNNVKRLPDGSYSARFPWKYSHPALPTNFQCVLAEPDH